MLQGQIERCNSEMLVGWAIDDNEPNEPVFVDILIDACLHTTVRADIPRPDIGRASGGFEFTMPDSIRFRRSRRSIAVRHNGQSQHLVGSPRSVSFNQGATRVLVLIPAGQRYDHDCIRAHDWPREKIIRTYSNTGDWTVYDSSLKLLSYTDVEIANIVDPTDADIERYNTEFDYAFLRGSNFVNEGMNWERTGYLLSKLKISVIALAIGAQAESKRHLNIPESAIEVWRRFADHSASIGVRGTYTAEVLNGIGIKNVEVIGCPSLFRANNPYLRIGAKPLNNIHTVAFNLRREVTAEYAPDIQRYGELQKKLIRYLSDRFHLTITAHGESAEKAFFFKDEALLSEYEQELLDEGWFSGKDDDIAALYRNNLFYAESVAAYDDFIADKDLALGFRVHGNLPALANGVPAIMVDYDSRSRELADTFSIPQITLDDIDSKPFEEIYDPSLFDRFNAEYREHYRRMAQFLDRNGLAHNMAAI